MNSEQITAFLQEHWSWVTLIIGAVLLIGAIMNWNWLCDPTGKPDSHRYGLDFSMCPVPLHLLPSLKAIFLYRKLPVPIHI